MNAAVAIPEKLKLSRPGAKLPNNQSQVGNLLVELDHYRRQTAWLAMVNQLQARLGGATDLAGMLEAYSVWLMPQVAHDLVAFRCSEQGREYILCSSHGPRRRRMLEVAANFLNADLPKLHPCCRWVEDFYGCCWRPELAKAHGQLLIMRQGAVIDQSGVDLLTRTVDILAGPLRRGLAYEDLFEQARRDFLTGLANRRVFEERIGPILESARRYNHPLALLSMDLDCFKQLNDAYGHAEGDRALRRVAETLAAMVRTSDLLVRMGGDEFLLVMPDSDIEAAKILAHRICRAVGDLSFGCGNESLGISVGISPWSADLSLDDWLQRADEALYRAKLARRCWVCLAGDEERDFRSADA